MNEAIEDLERQLRYFADDSRSGLGFAGTPGVKAEARYGQTYQMLVRLSARRQLRRKYRLG